MNAAFRCSARERGRPRPHFAQGGRGRPRSQGETA
jgi:hypothetical protein